MISKRMLQTSLIVGAIAGVGSVLCVIVAASFGFNLSGGLAIALATGVAAGISTATARR
jgi:hypothetical protein